MPPTAPVTHRSGKGFGQYGSTTKRGTSLSAARAGWCRGAETIATPKMLASTALPVRVKIFSDGGRIWSVIEHASRSRTDVVPGERRSQATLRRLGPSDKLRAEGAILLRQSASLPAWPAPSDIAIVSRMYLPTVG